MSIYRWDNFLIILKMKFLFTLFVSMNCLNEITFSKPLPLSSKIIVDADHQSDEITDMNALDTRDVNDFYRPYGPNYFSSPNPIASWIYSIASGLSSPSNQIFPPVQYPSYANTFDNYSPPNDQEQYWYNPAIQYDWNQPQTEYDWNQPQTQPDFQSYGNGNAFSDYNGNIYGTTSGSAQPAITKKVSTIISDDSKLIKHKIILSPDHPDGTGYVSITDNAKTNRTDKSSKDGTVFYRF